MDVPCTPVFSWRPISRTAKLMIIIIIHYVYRYFISVCLFLACTPSQNLTLENPKEHTTISHYVLMTDLVFLAMFLENRHFLPHGLKVYARSATKEGRKTLKLLLWTSLNRQEFHDVFTEPASFRITMSSQNRRASKWRHTCNLWRHSRILWRHTCNPWRHSGTLWRHTWNHYNQEPQVSSNLEHSSDHQTHWNNITVLYIAHSQFTTLRLFHLVWQLPQTITVWHLTCKSNILSSREIWEVINKRSSCEQWRHQSSITIKL